MEPERPDLQLKQNHTFHSSFAWFKEWLTKKNVILQALTHHITLLFSMHIKVNSDQEL